VRRIQVDVSDVHGRMLDQMLRETEGKESQLISEAIAVLYAIHWNTRPDARQAAKKPSGKSL
jgi:hypothetical protein